MTTGVDTATGEILGIPARDAYKPPPARSPEWIAELRRATEEAEILLWGMIQGGHFMDADEAYIATKAHKLARELNKLANEKLSQVGYAQ